MDIKQAREKAQAIVSEMTVEEKMSQLVYGSPAIERLGIHEYNWWNEAAHGVARAGIATVFPHAISMAASFNPKLAKLVGEVVSTEARAKYNKSIEFGDRDIYKGLTYWAPNINIFRDPRWGRGQETYGECPCLTTLMGTAYIKGLQGEGEFLKAAACAKHFAVHSGPERTRHSFDAVCSQKDMFETYLPAFYHAVKAGVAGVMGAYNRTNGEPCCASDALMVDILRGRWGFEGYYVSDCGAIADISEHHHYTETMKDAAALALKKGCNLNCGEAYKHLFNAYEEDLITEEEITEAVVYLYTIRALLGEFEDVRPYSDVPFSKLDCDEHKALNLEAARQTLVLLENKDGFLPVKNTPETIAVIGPNAMSTLVLEGNYHGHASQYFTVADGVRNTFRDSKVIVADGSLLCNERLSSWDGFENQKSEGLAAASEADLTILCLGLDRTVEGEDTGFANDYTDCGDRKSISLPQTQLKLAEAVCSVSDNVIIVVMCGSSVDLGESIRSKAKAIIQGWYPGSLGGLAIAQLIKGDYSPSGKLPLTFYSLENTLPDFSSYDMDGRTYRYIKEEPLYPFGFGLSYTDFEYSTLTILSSDNEMVSLGVELTNVGSYDSIEKIQVYAQFTDSRTTTPNYQLCAVMPVMVKAGETAKFKVDVDRYWLKAVLSDGSRVDPDGKITLYVGGHQPDSRSEKLCKYPCISIEL